MKLRDLIKDLMDYDMDSDVTVHAANGTKPLQVEWIDDHSERTEGDTDEPRLTLCCYKLYDACPQNVELYHGVKRGARNGIDTSDWIWIPGCPVRSNPARAFSFLNFIFSQPLR